ncbi:DeoR/GlpR transcriptional regulator [Enterococcus durans]|uniref:DeoR/GlpR transcriptional regulator n=1 Tax=Enterococcus durans TaxID=53345 RepID=A0A5N0YQS6_9ENTE|nr:MULTISPECIES: DeoR/GlpR family DNA-binding transcription regulator [Enterococcus]KAA9177854.1 DeoR/GlpR transcriptional regulator [Enterococcus durans]KAA9183668.1 DeoR/GlpR transcriptional regulator [Enterococcus durans]KAA9184897.1 DeoR/GlpR transcriptional regulator [Enterococcus durans]KAA9189476.1 DeoR/GlpR transcriptional regulator [Enterococcus durans]KAA9192043.1 DeoR/GlpR transcriptional regulator [Enterococcus durans]
MLKQERQQKLLDLIQLHTYLSIAEIASRLEVSEMTIRRDITELAKQRKLTKLYGGAQKLDILEKELSTDEKIETNVSQKKYIGKIINSLIRDNAIIFLGAGTTIFYALPEIQRKNLFVITNSLIAFTYLKENTNYRILLTGGEFSHTTEEFVGEVAVRSFDNLNIDIAFAATNGIFDDNVTTAQFDEGAVQNAAFAKAKETCIVADSSKLGLSDVYTFTRLSEHDYLITDNEISDELVEHYSKYTTILREEF